MGTRKVLASLAAASMVMGSTAAAAAPAARVPAARVASPAQTSESLGGSGWAWFLALLILVGLVGVIAAGNDENHSFSP